jgi:hypothetical protein
MKGFRDISALETEVLLKNGCFCGDWSRVKVKEGFVAGDVHGM